MLHLSAHLSYSRCLRDGRLPQWPPLSRSPLHQCLHLSLPLLHPSIAMLRIRVPSAWRTWQTHRTCCRQRRWIAARIDFTCRVLRIGLLLPISARSARHASKPSRRFPASMRRRRLVNDATSCLDAFARALKFTLVRSLLCCPGASRSAQSRRQGRARGDEESEC